MECPNCNKGKVKLKKGRADGYYTKKCDFEIHCRDCRGTGEIQEGDWWMCDGSKHSGLEPFVVLRYEIDTHDKIGIWIESDGCTVSCDLVKPLYRVARAK